GSRFSKGLSTLNRGDLSMVSPSIHSYESTKACTGILLECPNDIREPLKRGIECTAKPFKYSTVKIISFECCSAYLINSAYSGCNEWSPYLMSSSAAAAS